MSECSNPHLEATLRSSYAGVKDYYCPNCRKLIDPKEVRWNEKKQQKKRQRGMLYKLICGHSFNRPYSQRELQRAWCYQCVKTRKVIENIHLSLPKPLPRTPTVQEEQTHTPDPSLESKVRLSEEEVDRIMREFERACYPEREKLQRFKR